MRFLCGNTYLLNDFRFHFLRQTLQCSKLLKQIRILPLEEHDNLSGNVRLLLGWDIVNDTLRYQTLDGVLCIHRYKNSHFSRHDQSGVAPVVLPASRQHHFRFRGAFDLDVSGSCRRSLPSPQTLPLGPAGLRLAVPTVRDCSVAAPLTARLSAEPPARLSVSENMVIFVVS